MKKILVIMVLVMVTLLSVGCKKDLPVGHYETKAECVEFEYDSRLATFRIENGHLYQAVIPNGISLESRYIIEMDSLCDKYPENDEIVRIRVDR